jgi:hypothetical protein
MWQAGRGDAARLEWAFTIRLSTRFIEDGAATSYFTQRYISMVST